MPLPTALQDLRTELAAATRDRDDYSAQARVQRGEAAAQESFRQREPFVTVARQLEMMSAGQAKAAHRLQAQIAEAEEELRGDHRAQLARIQEGQRAVLTADQPAAVVETMGGVVA